VRYTRIESTQIEHDAARCAISVAAYIRQRSLKKRPRGKDLTHAINQLAKLGGLLKHLHNEGLGHSRETANLLLEIKKAIHLLASMALKKDEMDGEDVIDTKNPTEEKGRI
jgi:hypothetical protein